MFDVHNAIDEAEPHAALVDRYFDVIRHVHVNELDGRHCGTGDYDFKPVFEVLRRRGYKGWISLEAFDFTPGAETPGQRIPAPSRKPDSPTAIMSHYVVTGGAGFIGSAITRRLLAEGAGRVVVIDNLLSGSESNLEEIRSRIDFQRADIRNYEEIAPIIRGAAVVFHEAAIPSVPRSIDDPVPSHDVNANGTFNVLRAAKEGQVGRVVYAASSSAYGDTDVLPKVESMTPRPKSPYALQKLLGEYYCNVFTGVYGLETVSLRYFNVYGPRQDPGSPYSGVLSLFMTAALNRTAPHDLRRRRAIARLHLRGRRGGTQSEGRARQGCRRQGLQRRQRRPHHAQPILGAAAEAGRHRHSRRCTARRAPATCAIRRPTPRSPYGIWVTPRATPSRRACGSRWSGIAMRTRPRPDD